MKNLLLVMILLALAGCQTAKPREITRTVEVAHVQYVPLDLSLLPTIENAHDPATVTTNGEMFDAWQHDAGELGKCKPALDAIRRLQPHGI